MRGRREDQTGALGREDGQWKGGGWGQAGGRGGKTGGEEGDHELRIGRRGGRKE